MSTASDAAIGSIGAAAISGGRIVDDFYVRVDLVSSQQAGGRIDAACVKWWLEQSDEARAELIAKGKPLGEALDAFSFWLDSLSRKRPNEYTRIWGNGAAFDNVVLGNAYEMTGKRRPWRFWQDRCFRTVKDLSEVAEPRRKGTHHNALDDALHQARHLIRIRKSG